MNVLRTSLNTMYYEGEPGLTLNHDVSGSPVSVLFDQDAWAVAEYKYNKLHAWAIASFVNKVTVQLECKCTLVLLNL